MTIGLKNITRSPITVKVGDSEIPVHGISVYGIGVLVERFPTLYALLAERRIDLEAKDLIKLGPEIICAIIACGLGCPGDKEQEALATELSVGEQFDLIVAILKRTFPRGLGPFVEELEAGAGQVSAFVGTGRVQATSSPSRSNDASPLDILQTPSGNTLQESSTAGEKSSSGSPAETKPT